MKIRTLEKKLKAWMSLLMAVMMLAGSFVIPTYAASSCSVTFDFGEDADPVTLTFTEGDYITQESFDQAATLAFDSQDGKRTIYGWYKDSDCAHPWDSAVDTAYEGLTLYADTGYTTKGLMALVDGKYYRNSNEYGLEGKDGSLIILPLNIYISLNAAEKKTGYYRVPENIGAPGSSFCDFYVTDGVVTKIRYKESNIRDLTYVPGYCVKFDANGGQNADGASNRRSLVLPGGKAVKPANPHRTDGYTFDGWYTEKTGGSKYNFSTAVNANFTLYAHWLCDVRYDYNYSKDGKPLGVKYTEKVKLGSAITGHTPTARTGYTFMGWYQDADCTQVYDASAAVNAPMTLFAKWTANTYTVTLDLNGIGSGASSIQAAYDTLLTPPAEPVDETYGFEGWYKDAACTKKWDFATDKVTGNMTLYAHWMPPVTVTLSMNGTQTLGTVSVKYNTIMAQPADPSGSWYTFGGWYKDSAYQTVWDFSKERVTEDTTIYARCFLDCRVEFVTDHGIVPEPQMVKYGQKVAEPEAPYEEMWRFTGWYKDSACTEPWDFANDTVPEESLILYAGWLEETYVMLDPMNGEGGRALIEIVGEKISSYIPNYTNGSKMLEGWYLDKAYTKYFDIENDLVVKNMSLFAKWADSCTVIFNYGDGSPEMVETASKELIRQPLLDEMAGKYSDASGKTKVYGWYKDRDCAHPWDPAADKAHDGLTLYADIGYTTKGLMALVDGKYYRNSNEYGLEGKDGSLIIMPLDIYISLNAAEKKTGYYRVPVNIGAPGSSFCDFYVTDGVVTKIRYKESNIRDLTYVPGYCVKFDANGGQNADGASNCRSLVLPGGKAVKPANPHRTDGYTFDGWYTEKTGGSKYNFSTAVNANFTLYAHWTENTAKQLPTPAKYTVSFNMNGHGTQITAQIVVNGNKAIKPADPTADGYTFDGWYADATFGAEFDFNTKITADITIYAKWTKNAAAPTDPSVPQTGDNSHMLLWAVLFAASCAALTGTAIYSKKRGFSSKKHQ